MQENKYSTKINKKKVPLGQVSRDIPRAWVNWSMRRANHKKTESTTATHIHLLVSPVVSHKVLPDSIY